MSCPKNIKDGKFLWNTFKYEGEHNYKLKEIIYYVDQDGIAIYKIIWDCTLCRCQNAEWMRGEEVIRKWGKLPEWATYGLSGEDFEKQIAGTWKPKEHRFY